MQESQFKNYLNHHHIGKSGAPLAENTIQSRISNCKTVEAHEGNLDDLFDQDGLADLLSRLNYTTADQNSGEPLQHKIPIIGNWRNGSATLKAAVALYRSYKTFETHPGDAPSRPTKTAQAKPPTPPVSVNSSPCWS